MDGILQYMDERNLGEPALTISGLGMWVHKRQFPDSTDEWDGNWLDVTVRVKDLNARVWTSGAILTTVDLAAWRDGCRKLLSGGADTASLVPVEPELKVTMRKTDAAGRLEMRVDITPDHLHQEHTFRIRVDQSYLTGLIDELEAILREFPVR